MKLTRKQFFMLGVLVFGTFVTVLNQTVTTPAIPPIMAEMGVDASTAQWLTTGFTLVNAIMIPVTAYLTDKYSTRLLFITSMSLFTIGSLLAAIGLNFPMLLCGRLIQAAGAGVLMPMVMTVLMLTFPVEQRGSAMGIFGIVIAFAPAIGPSAAGIVIDNLSWHFMFYIVAGLSLLIIIASLFALEKTKPQHEDAKLDKLSVLLSSIGFGALLYGFSTIGSVGLNVEDSIITLIGIVALIWFFARQLRMEHPMLQVRVLANRRFLIGTIIGMLVQGSLLVAGVLMPIYLQSLMGYSATLSGLMMLPGAIIMGAMGPIAGRLFDRHGPRILSLIGMSILTICTLGFAFLSETTSVAFLTVLYTVRMFAMSLVNMPITTWAMNALDNSVLNHGTSVNNTLRQVAGSLGTAVLVSICGVVTASNTEAMGELHANILGVNAAFGASTLLCVIGLILTISFVKVKPEERGSKDSDNAYRTVLEKVMKRDVFTIPASASVAQAMNYLVEKGISAAPLVDDNGKAVGFISDGDIMRFLSKRSRIIMDPVVMILNTTVDTEGFDSKLQSLMSMNVRSIGKKGVIGVDIHSSLPEVCRVLGENHLKKVAVLENGKIVGVINRSDITQYAMRQYLEKQGEDLMASTGTKPYDEQYDYTDEDVPRVWQGM